MTTPPALAPMAGPAPKTPALPAGTSPARLHQVAEQFEALLVRQMLGAARADGLGDGLTGSGAMDNFRAMQDERFAAIAAHKGAFGLARMIETQLARRLSATGQGG